MASLWEKNEVWIVGYKCHQGKRRTIRLGEMTKHQANETLKRVEALNTANTANTPPDKTTAKWVAELGAVLHKRLAAVELVPPRDEEIQMTLADFLNTYIDSRKDLEEGTLKNLRNTKDKLIKYFGVSKPIRKIDEGNADDFKQHLVNNDYSTATISKHIKYTKHFFKKALRKKLVNSNPFADVVGGSETNKERLEFVERATIQKIMDVCPDVEFQLVIALSRYGAFRCPSETLALKWSDIDWADDKITIRSPKTRKQNKPDRLMPLFPVLKPYLEAVWEIAPAKSDAVIRRYRDTSGNLRTRLTKLCIKAKVPTWERIFHNLRASRIIELADKHPAHVVASWVGHTPLIAEEHYLKVVESHFESAMNEDAGTTTNKKTNKKTNI